MNSGIRIVPSIGDKVQFVSKIVDPTTSDIGYPIPCLWVNTVLRSLWFYLGSGVWSKLSSSSSPSGWGTPNSVTISGGSITVIGSGMYEITGEGGLADNLDTIAGGTTGDEIICYASDSSATITARHNQDNIQIGYNFAMDHLNDKLRLIKQSDGNWVGGGILDNA